jgi:hypothetical protein
LYFVELNIGEIMDVMNDLLNLKLAIQSNNREHVENIYELYKYELPSFSHTFSSEQLYRFEMDTMASFLIPFDLSLHYTRFQQSRHWTMETAYLIQCHFFLVIRTDCLLSYDFWLLPSFLWMLTNTLIIQSYNSLMIAQRSPMTGKTCLLYYYVRKQAL